MHLSQAISKQTATLSLVVPFIRVLLKSWEKEDDDGIRTMKDKMIQSLKSRFAGIEDNQLLSVATLIDPRFKDCFFDNIAKACAKDMVQEEIRKQESTASAETLATEDRTKAHPHQKGIRIIHYWRYFLIL